MDNIHDLNEIVNIGLFGVVPPEFLASAEMKRKTSLKVSYRQKKFFEVSFSFFSCNDSTFLNSKFLNCGFKDSDFSDTEFNQCYFKQTIFENCSFRNVSFLECMLDNCNVRAGNSDTLLAMEPIFKNCIIAYEEKNDLKAIFAKCYFESCIFVGPLCAEISLKGSDNKFVSKKQNESGAKNQLQAPAKTVLEGKAGEAATVMKEEKKAVSKPESKSPAEGRFSSLER